MESDESDSSLVVVSGMIDPSEMDILEEVGITMQDCLSLPATEEGSRMHIYEYDAASSSGSEDRAGAPEPWSYRGINQDAMFNFTGRIPDSESNVSVVTSSSMDLNSKSDHDDYFFDHPKPLHARHDNNGIRSMKDAQSDGHENTRDLQSEPDNDQYSSNQEDGEPWMNVPVRFVSINKVLPFTYAAIKHLLYFFAVVELMLNQKLDPLLVGVYMGVGYGLKWITASLIKFAPKTISVVASILSMTGFLLILLFHDNIRCLIAAIIIIHGNEIYYALQLFAKDQCQKDLKEMAQHLKNQHFVKTLAPPIIYFVAGLLRRISLDIKSCAKLGLLLSGLQMFSLILYIFLDNFRVTSEDESHHPRDQSSHNNSGTPEEVSPSGTFEDVFRSTKNYQKRSYILPLIATSRLFMSNIQKAIARRKLLSKDFSEIAEVLETYRVQKNYERKENEDESIDDESATHNQQHRFRQWASYLHGVRSCVLLLSFEVAPLLFRGEYRINWDEMGYIYASVTFPVVIVSAVMLMLFLWDERPKSFPLDIYMSGFGITLFALVAAIPHVIALAVGLAGMYLSSSIYTINMAYFQAIQIDSHNLLVNEFWITLHCRHLASLLCIMFTPYLYSKLRMLPSLIAFWLAFGSLIVTLFYCECCYRPPKAKIQSHRETFYKSEQQRSKRKHKTRKRKKESIFNRRSLADSNYLTPSDIVVLNCLITGHGHIL